MTTLTSKAVRFITAAALGLGLLWSAPSRGAPPNTIGNSVAVCDPWNPQRCAQPDASGNLPITGSFSAAGFTPATTGTPITATTLGVTGTLPAGAVVAAFNVGTTNTAYCQLGASATVNDIAIPPASWFALTVGAATQLTCITASGTTQVNMVGGSGQPTGAGGGGGGSGGGAVTIADGADVAQGATADAACGSDTGTCSQIALIKRLLQGQTTLNTNVTASVPSGTARIGYTSDDPCTSKTKLNKPFTTNGTASVELVALSGSTTIYVCSLAFIVSSASKVAFTTGTGTACATGNAAVIGSTTANIANSMSFAANGGLTLGGGHGTIAKGAASSALCMVNSVDQYTSGNLTYVQE